MKHNRTFFVKSRLMNNKQGGVALLTALLVVALASIAATALLKQQYLHIRRSANVLQGQQAAAYALGAETWAQQILRRDAGRNQYDALTDDWAFKLPPMPVEGGSVQGELEDLQGRFNVNTLLTLEGEPNEIALETLRRLLNYLELPPEIAAQALDWMDADQNPSIPGGAEDLDYLRLQPPYRCANRLFSSPSELRLLLSMDEERYRILQPYVTTLPTATKVNVNTSSVPVLLALVADLSQAQAEAVLETAQQDGFKSLQDFTQQDALKDMNINTQLLDIQSNYFLLRAQAHIERSQRYLTSVLHRDAQAVRVVLRSRSENW